jgi:hypothetical protein
MFLLLMSDCRVLPDEEIAMLINAVGKVIVEPLEEPSDRSRSLRKLQMIKDTRLPGEVHALLNKWRWLRGLKVITLREVSHWQLRELLPPRRI